MSKELAFSVTEKDLEIQTFYSGGPGGQNQNKRSTGVRIIHKESGAVGESREERSQLQNKKKALEKLANSKVFRTWVNRILSQIDTGKTVDQIVNEQMKPENIKIEVKQDEKWVKDES
jgi:protein subunit release factor A